MTVDITKVELKEILHLRALFMQESNFQVRYNAVHERGWSDSYLISVDGKKVGYGSVMGIEDRTDRNDIFEFYLTPAYRNYSSVIFKQLIDVSTPRYIECQSNDLILSSMLYEYAHKINSEVVLFKDGPVTEMAIPGITVRKREKSDEVFDHKHEPDGDYVLISDKQVVATGGFLLHYNFPFADLYMEVHEDHRQKGYGSLLIQEIKKACYLSGRVPAARCGITNKASKATLLKGGMAVAGYMLSGEIKG
jgi:GNAT superfamily N-acetyltransferase